MPLPHSVAVVVQPSSCDLNLGPFSLPCELDVLVMKKQLEADECDIDTDEELSDLETLHSILVSTSLSLE